MNAWRRVNQFMKKYFPTLWFVFKVIVCISIGLVLLILLGSFILSIYGSRKLNAVRAEAAAKGVALSMKEIVARRPAVAEEENAANMYEAAFRTTSGGERTDKPVPLVSIISLLNHQAMDAAQKAVHDDLDQILMNPGEPFPEYILEETRKYVERRDKVALLLKASAMPKCSYHVDWASGERPSYGLQVREAARITCVAAWLDAEEGRASEAAAKIRAGIALASSLTGELSCESLATVRNDAFSTAMDGLMRVVSRANVSNDDLLKLQKDVEAFGAQDVRRKAVEADVASGCHLYEDLLEGRKRPSEVSWIWENMATTKYGRVAPRAERGITWLVRGLVKLDETAMIKCHLVFLDGLDDPGTASTKAADEVAAIVGKNGFCLAVHWPSWLRPLMSLGVKAQSRAKAAAAALAALRYRNDTGKWPETLDVLVPAYIEKVSAEPIATQPLNYIVLPDGMIVYSGGAGGGRSGFLIQETAEEGTDK